MASGHSRDAPIPKTVSVGKATTPPDFRIFAALSNIVMLGLVYYNCVEQESWVMNSLKINIFFLTIILLLSGCGGGTTTTTTTSTSPTSVSTTTSTSSSSTTLGTSTTTTSTTTTSTVPTGEVIYGYVFQSGGTVEVVDNPSNASAGMAVGSGVAVKVLDITGEVVATATTDVTGLFQITNFSSGYLSVQVRLDPSSLNPDETINLTAIPNATLVLGKSYTISREAATALALSGVSSEALVAGTLTPLPAGVVIKRPSGTDEVTGLRAYETVRTLSEAVWFYFVDLFPVALYAHPVQYVFVSAQTGDVTRLTDYKWPPRVNDFALWSRPSRQLFTYNGINLYDLDFDDLPSSWTATEISEVVQLPQSFINSSVSPYGTCSEDHRIYVVLLKVSEDDGLLWDVNEMWDFFSPDVETGDMASVDTTIQGVTGYTSQINAFNQTISDRLDSGLHSTLILFITGHGMDDVIAWDVVTPDGGQTFVPGQLGLQTTRACRVRVIINSCYAEKMADNLEAILSNAGISDYCIYASSLSSQYSALYNPWKFFARTGSPFVHKFMSVANIVDGDITGATEGNLALDTLFPQTPNIHPD